MPGSACRTPATARQAAWALVARGARVIEYWHWHTLRFGTETCWGGILPHSGRPGRSYGELARLGAEFGRAGDLVAGITPDADIAMVYSAPSKWLMNKYPPLAGPDGGPDGGAYEGVFDPFYRGAFETGRHRHRHRRPTVHVVHNWSWQPATAQAAVDLTDVLDDSVVPAGASVPLGAWDVRVLAVAPGTPARDR